MKNVISIRVKSSAAEAVEELNWIPRTLAGPGPRYPLPAGFADAGYMFARYGPADSATLYFVKDDKVVLVSGRSEAVATRFARLVARELP